MPPSIFIINGYLYISGIRTEYISPIKKNTLDLQQKIANSCDNLKIKNDKELPPGLGCASNLPPGLGCASNLPPGLGCSGNLPCEEALKFVECLKHYNFVNGTNITIYCDVNKTD